MSRIITAKVKHTTSLPDLKRITHTQTTLDCNIDIDSDIDYDDDHDDHEHDHEHACDGDTNKNSLFTALIGIHIFTDELSPAPMLGLCLGTFYIFSLLSLLYIYM